jgi:hypothetical protein
MRLLGEIAHSLRVTPAELLTPGAFQAPTQLSGMALD